jgi:mRNA interferase MazF
MGRPNRQGDLVIEYIPERGDLIWVDFDPHAGREQAGRRPALVLSPATYNGKAGLAIVCPITSRAKGYPFEVTLSEKHAINGVILVDHVKSLDWSKRRAEKAGRLVGPVLQHVQHTIALLLGIPVPS